MNKVNLTGRFTKDPELRKTRNGTSIIEFNLAVQRRLSKEQREAGEREADFPRVRAWAKVADFIYKWCKKGTMVSIVGRIQTDQYEKDNQTVYTTDVVVEDFELIKDYREKETYQTYREPYREPKEEYRTPAEEYKEPIEEYPQEKYIQPDLNGYSREEHANNLNISSDDLPFY